MLSRWLFLSACSGIPLAASLSLDMLQSGASLLLSGNHTLPTNLTSIINKGSPKVNCDQGQDNIYLRSCREAQRNLLKRLDADDDEFLSFRNRDGSASANIVLPYVEFSGE